MKTSYLAKVFKTLTDKNGEYRLTDLQAINAMELTTEQYDAVLDYIS